MAWECLKKTDNTWKETNIFEALHDCEFKNFLMINNYLIQHCYFFNNLRYGIVIQ